MRVVALIPAFNEEQTVAAVVCGVGPFVQRVIVVDDGCTDATAARAREAGAEVLTHDRNRGKGEAVRTGLARVFAGDFTHVLLIDGDLQHIPGEAARLLDIAASSGTDVVIGARQFRRDGMPASRYHANRIGSRALSSFVGVPIPDTQCGFRVFRVDALRPIALVARGYDIETEMLIKVRRRGGQVATAPVTAVYDGRHSKLRPIRDTTRTCFLAVYYRFIERV
jgi:glycosyltransferase involved in cell wall biosynthesis